MNIAIIIAGGSGHRMGQDIPKAAWTMPPTTPASSLSMCMISQC